MRTWTWTSWSGNIQKIEADQITFESGGTVAFWIRQDAATRRLVLAVKATDWNGLHEVVPPAAPR